MEHVVNRPRPDCLRVVLPSLERREPLRTVGPVGVREYTEGDVGGGGRVE